MHIYIYIYIYIYISNILYITTCYLDLGGFQEKFSSFIQKQTPANSVVRHDWNFKWLISSDETKQKNCFLAANPPDELVQTGIKSTSCPVKYTAGSFMLWAYVSAGGPGHLV